MIFSIVRPPPAGGYAIATSIVRFRLFPNGDWEYEYKSPGCETLFGYTSQEIITMKNLWMSRIHPQDRETVIKTLFQDLLAGNTAKIEYRFHHQDNSWRWISATYTSRYDAATNSWIVTGSSTDISEQQAALRELKQAEEKLRQREAQLASAQQIAHVGSWEWNLETQQRHWSTETFRIFGLNPSQSEPNLAEFVQMIHPDDRAHMQIYMGQAIAHGIPFNVEYRIVRPDGSMRYLESKAEIVKNAQGQTVKLLGAILDITERKQTELEIIRSRDLLEAIYNESADALFLVDAQTLLTTDCNDRAVELFEASSKAELLNIEGQTLQKRQFTPEELATIIEEIDKQRLWSREIEYITKQGNSFWGNIAIKQITVAGQAMNLVRVTDITTRKCVEADRQQAEAALAKSEEQLRLTLELTNIGVWDWNVPTGEVLWNDNHYRLLGVELETSAGKYQLWRNAIHPEDVDRVEKALFNALAQHTNYETEYRVIHPNGKVYWLTGKGRGLYNEVGKPVRMLGVIIDVSERKRAAQALQEKESFLRSIYDGVGQSIFVVDVLDDDFRFVGLNPTHEALTGLCSSELQGKTPEQCLPPTIAVAVRQHYQDCVTAGETITYEECLPFQRQETCWITSLTPLRDENSNIYRIVGNSVNITEHKHAQQLLELQAVITRNMAEGICLVRSADGVIVYANPKFEQMFGYESGELIGQHISVVNYEDEDTNAEAVYEAIAAAVAQNGEANYEVHNLKKDGTSFWCMGTSSVFEHPEHGTVFVAVQQDITEKKQAEEQIKASLREKEVLLKEIHHRVKNNLGIVSSLLQMQCRRTQDSQASAILRDSQNRIASIALVHEKLYRSENLADIDFAQYIPDLTTHLFDSYNVSSSRIQLDIQVDDACLDVETAISCGLIINELISNALKYAFPGDRQGKIQVRFCQECKSLESGQRQCTWILKIQDNGIGLPEDYDTKKAKTLGLTLVQGLVKQLRGTIQINSQEGTEFKIIFSKSTV
ncbi:two-component sensor histidine kinase [Cylindrospermum sp. NIES-4074]|nr:two-component sensor histidine kinase [Cylindrospermum sp. NIES-4074]